MLYQTPTSPEATPNLPNPLVEDYFTSGADPRDISTSQITEFRTTLDGSLYVFAQLIFGYTDLIPTLHKDISDYLGAWGSEGYRRLMTQIPREMFKTSMGTIANGLWQICKEPHLPVALIGAKVDNAEEWLRTIRKVVMANRLFQTIYSDLLPPGVATDDTRSLPRWWKWSDSQLDFEGRKMGERENSISAAGVEGAIEGHHWPKIIGDDWIGKKQKQSETEMERVREFVRGFVYLMRPAERGLAYINCTPWTYHDIYVDLLKSYGFKLYRRSALENKDGLPDIVNGQSIFPDKLSTEELRGMYDRDASKGDEVDFWAQMMCIPRPGKVQSFNPEHVRHGTCNPNLDEPQFIIEPASYSEDIGRELSVDNEIPPRVIPLHWMSKALFVDPAPSDERGTPGDKRARNGLLMRGKDAWGREYYLESWAGRADYLTVIRKMFEMLDRWGADKVYIEEVVFSNVYRHWINRETRPGGEFAGRYVHIIPCKPGKRDKGERINERTGYWKQGLCYLNKIPNGRPGEGWCEDYLQEQMEYPNGLTKDLLDADGYSGMLHRPESPGELLAKRRRLGRMSTRDPVVGY